MFFLFHKRIGTNFNPRLANMIIKECVTHESCIYGFILIFHLLWRSFELKAIVLGWSKCDGKVRSIQYSFQIARYTCVHVFHVYIQIICKEYGQRQIKLIKQNKLFMENILSNHTWRIYYILDSIGITRSFSSGIKRSFVCRNGYQRIPCCCTCNTEHRR